MKQEIRRSRSRAARSPWPRHGVRAPRLDPASSCNLGDFMPVQPGFGPSIYSGNDYSRLPPRFHSLTAQEKPWSGAHSLQLAGIIVLLKHLHLHLGPNEDTWPGPSWHDSNE